MPLTSEQVRREVRGQRADHQPGPAGGAAAAAAPRGPLPAALLRGAADRVLRAVGAAAVGDVEGGLRRPGPGGRGPP